MKNLFAFAIVAFALVLATSLPVKAWDSTDQLKYDLRQSQIESDRNIKELRQAEDAGANRRNQERIADSLETITIWSIYGHKNGEAEILRRRSMFYDED